MTHTTAYSSEISLSASKFDLFRLVLKFLADGFSDMNRYLDAASLVHPAGRPELQTNREQFWEWPL